MDSTVVAEILGHRDARRRVLKKGARPAIAEAEAAHEKRRERRLVVREAIFKPWEAFNLIERTRGDAPKPPPNESIS